MSMFLKRGQEEVVGFIAVVVLLIIVFLIFVSLNASKPAEIGDSTEISQFLGSGFEYTSKCALDYAPNYLRVGELFEACYKDKSCISGERSCEVLNSVLDEMVVTGLKIGENRPRTGYNLKAVYIANEELASGEKPEVTSLIYGQCKFAKLGSVKSLPAEGGIIRVTLEVC